VLKQIPDIIKEYPNYLGDLNIESETEFRFKLHSKLDKDREIIMTILAFDVPK